MISRSFARNLFRRRGGHRRFIRDLLAVGRQEGLHHASQSLIEGLQGELGIILDQLEHLHGLRSGNQHRLEVGPWISTGGVSRIDPHLLALVGTIILEHEIHLQDGRLQGPHLIVAAEAGVAK